MKKMISVGAYKTHADAARLGPRGGAMKATIFSGECMKAKFRRLALALVACTVAMTGAVEAGLGAENPVAKPAQISREYLIKAAFLYNFAKFAEWPADAFGDSSAPLRVCMIGDDPFGIALDSIVGKKVGQRRVITSRFADAAGTEQCHVLFVSASEERRLVEILEHLRYRPVLTVADMPNFARLGGIINLKTVGNKVRFEINTRIAELAGLKLNSRLLDLGDVVRETPAQAKLP